MLHVTLIQTHLVVDVTTDEDTIDSIIKSGNGLLDVETGDIITVKNRRYRVLRTTLKQRGESEFWLKTQFVSVEPVKRLSWLTRIWENLFGQPNLLATGDNTCSK